jgi:riboflavin synthase
MFTGIITSLGVVESVKVSNKKDLLLQISAPKNQIKRQLEIGCSIACNGICLTLVEKKTPKENSDIKIIFSFQASQETCAKSTLANWQIGQLVNLEFALRMGDELGGHMVLGHVDSTCKISAIKRIKDSHQFTFVAPKNLMKFIAPKGSITLNGVSLTINKVKANSFDVNLIWHTLENTAFKNAKIGDEINLEIDAMARYAAKLLNK